jgi:AcrR family transcriptional regulator
VGYKHSAEEIAAAAAALALDEGLGALTFGRVARRLGVADRTVVYYFPSKADLVLAAVATMGTAFQDVLDQAFGEAPLPPDELAARAWPVLSSDQARPLLAVFLELIGLSAARTPPYDTLAATVVNDWIAWLVPRIAADDPAQARAGALGVLVRLDGLLVLLHSVGAATADEAAAALGLVRDDEAVSRGGRPRGGRSRGIRP